MKNVTELREQLSTLFTDLQTGKIDPKVAKEMTNVAGKILNSITIQLKGHALNDTKHKIKYLGDE
jgi:hypothetical protein